MGFSMDDRNVFLWDVKWFIAGMSSVFEGLKLDRGTNTNEHHLYSNPFQTSSHNADLRQVDISACGNMNILVLVLRLRCFY